MFEAKIEELIPGHDVIYIPCMSRYVIVLLDGCFYVSKHVSWTSSFLLEHAHHVFATSYIHKFKCIVNIREKERERESWNLNKHVRLFSLGRQF